MISPEHSILIECSGDIYLYLPVSPTLKTFLSANYLKLNDSKTEFVLAVSNYNLKHLDSANIELTIW